MRKSVGEQQERLPRLTRAEARQLLEKTSAVAKLGSSFCTYNFSLVVVIVLLPCVELLVVFMIFLVLL